VIHLAQAGGPLACVGLAVLLVAGPRRGRLAGLGLAVVGTGLLGLGLAPNAPGTLAIAVAAVLAAAGGVAIAFRLVPWLLPLAALACIPVRIGVHVGGSGSKLLVPLYVVIIAAAIYLGWQVVRGDERARELGIAAWPLALYLAWTGASLVWSKDVHAGAIELLAFYVPFTILALGLARLPWSRAGVTVLYVQVVAMGLGFAIVGFYQYQTRDIFQNAKVINSNAYAPFFRVNSVFWDPSVYGRFLVVAIVPSAVLLVRERVRLLTPVVVAAIVVLWLGLLISFSQSSFAALLVGIVGATIVAWRWRALVAVAVAVAVLAGIAVSAPQLRHSIQHHTSSGLNSATSGRFSLVANGIRIAQAHPVAGVGVGGFKRAYADRVHRFKSKEPKTAASHNTPVTVAAETGLVGLVLFVALVGALLLQAFRRADRSRPGGVALAAALLVAAILCHSFFYNDFFEDPTTWGLFGLIALVANVRLVQAGGDTPPPAAAKEAVPV
jgi:O-antigen ligase